MASLICGVCKTIFFSEFRNNIPNFINNIPNTAVCNNLTSRTLHSTVLFINIDLTDAYAYRPNSLCT